MASGIFECPINQSRLYPLCFIIHAFSIIFRTDNCDEFTRRTIDILKIAYFYYPHYQTHMQELVDLLKSYDFLSPEELKVIQEASTIQTLKAEEHLFKKGDYFYHEGHILKGVMRIYEINSKGEERTIYIGAEGTNVGSLETMFRQEKSRRFAQAIEDTTLLLVDSQIMDEKEKQYPRVMKQKMMDMERLLLILSERASFFALYSPEERFIDLQENQPELIHRIPQKYLASYIGVSTVSFSRIKARIYKKNREKKA